MTAGAVFDITALLTAGQVVTSFTLDNLFYRG
jgi:hypothetical protein